MQIKINSNLIKARVAKSNHKYKNTLKQLFSIE